MIIYIYFVFNQSLFTISLSQMTLSQTPWRRPNKKVATNRSNNPALEISQALQSLWLYNDSEAVARTAWLTPVGVPYNREINWKMYTFMTGQTYSDLFNKRYGFNLPNFDSDEDQRLHEYIATLFSINITQSAELCTQRSEKNGSLIKAKLNNTEPTGLQHLRGGTWDEEDIYCWLPLTIKGEFISARVLPEGDGALFPYHGDEARVALL